MEGSPVATKLSVHNGGHECRFSASDVVLLGPDKVPAVRLYVFGESFMFNMIRHMVGMAVAVSRGALQAHYVPASLASSSLCTCACTPLPHALQLLALSLIVLAYAALTARCMLHAWHLRPVPFRHSDIAHVHAGCRWLLPTPWCCTRTRFDTFERHRRCSRRLLQLRGSR